jgi:subtilisin family serine protease
VSSSAASPITLEEARRAIETGTGAGIRVAVIDSGIEVGHPDLAGLELADDIAVENDGLNLATVPGGGVDVFGHGTAIAGIVRPLAPDARIGSFRVLNERLGGKTATIREGVRQAIDRGYHILNCSFGCRGDVKFIMHYKEWIDEAYLKGIHVVSACNNFDFTVPEWPGYFPSVITVNMGRAKGLDFYYQRGHLVEFVAAGDNVAVPWIGGTQKTVTGSSYAAPHVAAILARLLSVYPDLPPLEAKALLHRLAEPYADHVAGNNVPWELRARQRA